MVVAAGRGVFEVFLHRAAGGTYRCSRAGGAATDLRAYLLADPRLHHAPEERNLRRPAGISDPIADPAERRAELGEIVADLNQPHDPGTICPIRLEEWADTRLSRINFAAR